MHNFRQLIIWKKGIEPVKFCYKLTENLSSAEKFGLIGQIQGASVSIPPNIAEGSGRSFNKDFGRIPEMPYSSALEIETLYNVIFEIGFIEEVVKLVSLKRNQELQKMISAFLPNLT